MITEPGLSGSCWPAAGQGIRNRAIQMYRAPGMTAFPGYLRCTGFVCGWISKPWNSPIWQRAALQWVIRRERIHQLLEYSSKIGRAKSLSGGLLWNYIIGINTFANARVSILSFSFLSGTIKEPAERSKSS
jgi:hypothetical protein